MITVIAEFKLPQPLSVDQARETFLGTAPTLTYLACPVVVDNAVGEIVSA